MIAVSLAALCACGLAVTGAGSLGGGDAPIDAATDGVTTPPPGSPPGAPPPIDDDASIGLDGGGDAKADADAGDACPFIPVDTGDITNVPHARGPITIDAVLDDWECARFIHMTKGAVGLMG